MSHTPNSMQTFLQQSHICELGLVFIGLILCELSRRLQTDTHTNPQTNILAKMIILTSNFPSQFVPVTLWIMWWNAVVNIFSGNIKSVMVSWEDTNPTFHIKHIHSEMSILLLCDTPSLLVWWIPCIYITKHTVYSIIQGLQSLDIIFNQNCHLNRSFCWNVSN